MKSLFAVLMTAFFVYSLSACGDSTDDSDSSNVADLTQDTSVSADVAVEDESDASDLDTAQEEAAGETAGTEENDIPEVPEDEQLPSDPTEDPDQEASFYEFPAWHIP